MRSVSAALLTTGLLMAPNARAGVSDPHAGVRLVNHGSNALVVADLCHAGVSVRATKYGERNKTAASWAQTVDAEVAINADFFDFPGWSMVVGRARGGGEDWPADKQLKEVRSYWQFGVNQAGLQPNAAVEPGFLVTEIVGGHNILIDAGTPKGPLYDGDAVLKGHHRRTAVGMSADRRYLYLFVSNTPLNGDGIVWDMSVANNESGMPPIHWATNMDGGGSSQLYVKGMGSVISSSRPVNNHLGIFAKGSGEPWHCNRAPEGWLDSADGQLVRGWARDIDVPDAGIDVHLYFGGPAGSSAPAKSLRASRSRDDLCTAIGSCAHGFELAPPLSLLDGSPHAIHAYGIDEAGLTNAELAGSPKVLQADAPTAAGARRHVVDMESFHAWGLDEFWHRLMVGDGAVAKLPEGSKLPTTPRLVRADDGNPAVYVVDASSRRHVTGPDAMSAWSFDFEDVVELPAAEIAALEEGPPWPDRPVIVKHSDGSVYVLDSLGETLGPPPSLGSGGSHQAGSGSAFGNDPRPSDVDGGCHASRRPADGRGALMAIGFVLLALGRRRIPQA
jgi:hypothetical protein